MFQALKRLIGLETRASGRLDDPLTALILGGWGPTVSGIEVTAETALRNTAVFAAIRVVAESVAQLPLHLYRKTADGGRERADDHPVYPLIADVANPWTPASEFRLAMQTSLSLSGNAYAFVGRDGETPNELIALEHGAVQIQINRQTMEPTYRVIDLTGAQREYSRNEILHVRGFGHPYRGVSPVEKCREAIGLGLVLERHGAGLFGRGARPAGILNTGNRKVDKDIAERLRASFERLYGGSDGAGRTMVLEEGWTFTAQQLSSVDAQFLELRKFQLQEICRIFRVPPHLIADLDRATFSNAETMGQVFLSYCLLPILRAWTDALKITLLNAEERKTLFFDFVIDDVARADLSARFTAYSQAINAGILNPNECRQMENRSPYPAGNTYMRPVNTAPAPTPGATKPTLVSNGS